MKITRLARHILLSALLPVTLFSQEELAFSLFPTKTPDEEMAPPTHGYTINYQDVAITEYLRFVSKICNSNFLFNDEDVAFNVTVVSEEPITPANVMATLLQILRIHGLFLLEQDNSLVIHKNPGVRQTGPITTEKGQAGTSPIVTRIFRIKNANTESIFAIIRPMISDTALLEISPETHQIILTDISASVDTVATLIENLDAPQTLLQINTFSAQHYPPISLVELATLIMTPLTKGTPFLLVPQVAANKIFIVTTPELTEQAISVLTSLDVAPSQAQLRMTSMGNGSDNFFLYTPVSRPGNEILQGLHALLENLRQTGSASPALDAALASAQWIPESNAILFVAPPEVSPKLKELLTAVDQTEDGKTGSTRAQFFIYKPIQKTGEQILRSLKDISENLRANQLSDPGFLDTLDSAKWVKSTNSILFTGDAVSIKRLTDLLATVDAPMSSRNSNQSQTFILYQLQHADREIVEAYLHQISNNLNKKDDVELIQTLRSAHWIAPSRSFMFHGSQENLARVQELLVPIDIPHPPPLPEPGKDFILYPLGGASKEMVENYLEQVAHNLKKAQGDAELIQAIQSRQWIKESDSFMFTGFPQALVKLQELLASTSLSALEKAAKPTYFLYRLQNVPGDIVEEDLDHLAKSFSSAGFHDKNILKVIHQIRYVKETNSLLITGDEASVEEVKELIAKYDIPRQTSAKGAIGPTSFLLYNLKQASGPQLLSSLHAIAADLKKSQNPDKSFLDALQSAKYIRETNSIFFVGQDEALAKVEMLVEKFDIASMNTGGPISPETAIAEIGPSKNFFVYKPQSLSGPDLEQVMQDFAQNLRLSGLQDPQFFQAVASMRWVEKSQSLIFAGDETSLARIKTLLVTFDIPTNLPEGSAGTDASIQAIDNVSFLVYKLQYHKGDEIQGALRQIAKDLISNNANISQTLLNSVNSVQWIEITNSLLCSGDQDTLTRLKELIKNLDVPLRQVFVEMLIIQTTLSNSLAFGLEWGSGYKYRNKFSASMGNFSPANTKPDTFSNNLAAIDASTTPVPSDVPFGQDFSLGVIGEVIRHNGNTFLSLGSLMNALQTDLESSIIMTPKLIMQDGKPASLFVGSNVPFMGSFINNTSANTIQTSNIEYRNVGVTLTITPVLGNSDVVTLTVHLDTSSITAGTNGTFTFTDEITTATGITTSLLTIDTTVHVPDNKFLILSGFIDNADTKTKAGIPCLGGLPVIGAAFSENNDTFTYDSLVIFLRPHILNSIEDMQRISAEQEQFFLDQQATPSSRYQFQEGMEYIKTVDDD